MDKRTEDDVTKVDQSVPFKKMNRRQKVVFHSQGRRLHHHLRYGVPMCYGD